MDIVTDQVIGMKEKNDLAQDRKQPWRSVDFDSCVIRIISRSTHIALQPFNRTTWRCHQMETFSALLPTCAGNSPVTGEFPAQRPVTKSFDVFFDLRLNKQLSKQSWG